MTLKNDALHVVVLESSFVNLMLSKTKGSDVTELWPSFRTEE